MEAQKCANLFFNGRATQVCAMVSDRFSNWGHHVPLPSVFANFVFWRNLKYPWKVIAGYLMLRDARDVKGQFWARIRCVHEKVAIIVLFNPLRLLSCLYSTTWLSFSLVPHYLTLPTCEINPSFSRMPTFQLGLFHLVPTLPYHRQANFGSITSYIL